MTNVELSKVAPLLDVQSLRKTFGGRGGKPGSIVAVDDISFSLQPGECLAVVGESGSGKSTLARTLLRLVEADSGAVLYQGKDLLTLTHAEMQRQRRFLQMVFQDPYASLHPRRNVAQLISEPWEVHPGVVEKSARRERIEALLAEVNLPKHFISYYPNQMSGGQRQRVAIARALALEPKILILDEPVSALDVSVQAQVIKVLMSLQERRGLAYIFISHDLPLVRLVAHKVAVMNRGQFVEAGSTEEIFSNPQHEYTKSLLASSPSAGEFETH
ncbi:ABC-type glutathione transport system ATPase component [Neorhizobium sp. 2083]|uniref:ATP-binding cassette domain-containing protein n=1 Tax=Neorhizobium sp. 2083 TaxID=2817762 RepID=UPI00285547FC|nr:ATP-binding cassette domain-containing protein [Neorhizobium sp. 2083]MDR6817421.1 ABC-type glutathione transport system ATPase component [Neorhizobium sp. 2083]